MERVPCIKRMASGNLSLLITEDVSWESFPEQARIFTDRFGGKVIVRIATPVERMWTVTIKGLVPWMFIAVGFSLYAFEHPRVLESVILLAVGIAALVAYRSLRSDVDNLRTASSATRAKPRAPQGER